MIGLFAGDEAVEHILATGDEVFLPSIAARELFHGARASVRAEATRWLLGKLASNPALKGTKGGA